MRFVVILRQQFLELFGIGHFELEKPTFVLGGLVQERWLTSQLFVDGEDLSRNGSKDVRGCFDALHGANGFALVNCRAFLGELDEYDVAEAFLRIVRDGHRPDSTLIVKRDQLVIWRVSFRDDGAPERERNGA